MRHESITTHLSPIESNMRRWNRAKFAQRKQMCSNKLQRFETVLFVMEVAKYLSSILKNDKHSKQSIGQHYWTA